jgi:hypothetical protein
MNRRSVVLLLLAVGLCLNARGQGFSPVDVRVSSVSGVVLFENGVGQPGTVASRGLTLSPGNVIDTTGGGRAVVELTDGSVIVVQPGSIVIFKDFHQAGSLRELFDITLGQVRVKINHYAGKPNPYRMNSPTASVAVRGTEFSIQVDGTGQTRVIVYEGSVEVTSLNDPTHGTLIDGGQGVLVTPGFDFQLFTPSERELAGNRDRANGTVAANGTAGQNGDHDQQTPRAQAGTYERYIAGLESLNSLPLLLRYNAEPEVYLDSAENPAYATAFQEKEARVYLLPSLRGTPEALENTAITGAAANLPSDYAMSSQVSAYAPLAKGKVVLGGTATASYFGDVTGAFAGAQVDPGVLGPNPAPGSIVQAGNSTSQFLSGSLLLASKFGANAFGVEAETLKGTGSLTSNTPDPNTPGTTLQNSQTKSDILQTRLTFGYKRELTPRTTFGAFARYGLISANNQDVFSFAAGVAQPLSRTSSPGHSAEVGVRLRGQISPKLYYGLEAAWFGLSLRDVLSTNGVATSQQSDQAHRGSAGIGLVYMLGRRTMLVGDFAGGISDIGATRTQAGNGLLLQNGTADGRFESAHIAVQQRITSRVFALASFLNVWQGNTLRYAIFPDSSGNVQPFSDSLFSTSPTAYLSPRRLSDFGAGVAVTRNLLVQYIFSTDYGFSSSSHTLMLRYTFHPSGQ